MGFAPHHTKHSDMSFGITAMHSHSGLERNLNIEKRFVLVDEIYKNRFLEDTITRLEYNKKVYYKVPIMSFVKNKGVFKNLEA